MKNHKTTKRIIASFLTVLMLILLLAGCTNWQSSSELDARNLSRCTPLAEAWFEDNMDGVVPEDIELCPITWGENYANVVSGVYTRDGEKSYTFILNVDTGAFLSEEYYDRLHDYMQDEIDAAVGIEYESVYFYLEGSWMTGTVQSDTNFGRKRLKLKVYDESHSYDWAYERFTEEELTLIAGEKLDEPDFEIRLSVKDADSILDTPEKLAFLMDHPNWKLVLEPFEEESADYRNYQISFEDDHYRVVKSFEDDKQKVHYETFELPTEKYHYA